VERIIVPYFPHQKNNKKCNSYATDVTWFFDRCSIEVQRHSNTKKTQLKTRNTFAVFSVFICDFYVSLWRWTSILQRSKTR